MNERAAYEDLTAKIIEQLENGVAPWIRPWSTIGQSDRPVNYSTRKPYHGSNVLQLWMAQAAFAYPTCQWMTCLQAKEWGATVRRGEHGTPIIFAQPLLKEQEVAGELQSVYAGCVLKGYTVFNVAQIDGIPARAEKVPATAFNPIAETEAFISAIGAKVTHGGDRAYYSQRTDSITLPKPEQFKDEASYYGTSLHEHCHWTGSEHRLNRTFGKRFGDQAYAVEELVAELAAAFLTADLCIPWKLQHPEYLSHWSKVLGDDRNALWVAGSAATKAAEYWHQQATPAASMAA